MGIIQDINILVNIKENKVQIFVPFAQPYKTARCLDNRRLAKQIIEAIQILSANTKINVGWKIPKYIYNHPNTLLWKDDNPYLVYYSLILCDVFYTRRKKHHKSKDLINKHFFNYALESDYIYKNNLKHITPEFCKQHQRKLLEKNYDYYKIYFGEMI